MEKIIKKQNDRKYLFVGTYLFRIISRLIWSDYTDEYSDVSLVSYDEFEGVDHLFDKHGIPAEYRKIVIQLKNERFYKRIYKNIMNGEEFLTKIPFKVEACYITPEFKTFKGEQKSLREGFIGCIFDGRPYRGLDRSLQTVACAPGNLYDVIKFYRDLREKGLLKNYVSCLMEVLSLVFFPQANSLLYDDEYFDKQFNLDSAIDTMNKKKRIKRKW